MVSPGGSTVVHGIDMPDEYEDEWYTQYAELLEKVDAGIVITVSSEPDLTSYEGGSHSGVLAFNRGNESFYVSSGGTFDGPISLSADFSSLTSTQINNLVDALDEFFLPLAGGTMDGDIDMNGNNVAGAGEVEADQLVLPTR